MSFFVLMMRAFFAMLGAPLNMIPPKRIRREPELAHQMEI